MSISTEEFYLKSLSFRCPYCKAEKGDICRDTSMRRRVPHAARLNEVRMALWRWEHQKTAECPTCKGRGRVKVVGQDATHLVERTSERLVNKPEHVIESLGQWEEDERRQEQTAKT